jgi:hypothetical protein
MVTTRIFQKQQLYAFYLTTENTTVTYYKKQKHTSPVSPGPVVIFKADIHQP